MSDMSNLALSCFLSKLTFLFFSSMSIIAVWLLLVVLLVFERERERKLFILTINYNSVENIAI